MVEGRNFKTAESNRLKFLDAIRGLACLLVMAQHVFERTYPGFERFSLDYLSIGMVGVVAFFLVSGFVIPLSLERIGSPWTFMIKRIFRIYPLYLFILLFTTLWSMANGNHVSLWTVIANVTIFAEYLKQPLLIGAAWTLSLELIWYLLFAVIYKFNLHKKTMTLIIYSSLAMVLLAIISLTANKILPLGRAAYLHSCFVGLLFYRLHCREIQKKEFIKALSIATLAMAPAFYVTYGHFKHPFFSVTCVFLSWSAGYLLFSQLYRLRDIKLNPAILYLGLTSYSIYLSHALIFAAYTTYADLTLPAGLLVFAMVILISHFTYRYIEAPGIALGKKLSRLTAAPL